MDIDTRDEGSGVKSVDIFYQISEGNGKSVIGYLFIYLFFASRFWFSYYSGKDFSFKFAEQEATRT